MTRIAGDVLRALIWSALAFGALKLASMPGEDSSEFCGIWGCYPPLQALAAMHAFWGVVAAAVTGWLLRHARTPVLKALGSIAIFAGVTLLTTVAAYGTITWLHSWGWQTKFVGQRLIYVIATSTDSPSIQLAGAGVVCWWVARRRERLPPNVSSGELRFAESTVPPGTVVEEWKGQVSKLAPVTRTPDGPAKQG